MFKNYLLIALRSLRREKSYAAINIVSLSIAIACCVVLLLYVRSEMTYDKHHQNHESIYRVANEIFNRGKGERFSITSQALGPLFMKEYPHAGEYVRFRHTGKTLFKTDHIEAFWDDIFMADENVFDVFSHDIIYGDAKDALVDPYSIVISRRFAELYFGQGNPVGKSIRTETETYQVKAVFENFPENTNLKYNALLSINLLQNRGQGDETLIPTRLFYIGFLTYFKLADGYGEADLQQWLNDFNDKVMTEPGKQFELTVNFHTQPLLDVHFERGWRGGPPSGNIFFVYGFIAVAIFVLFVACINYTNLATAMATKRAKEVGMRKVLGAEPGQLVTQFIGESLVYTLLSLVIGIVAVQLIEAYTPLNTLLNKTSLFALPRDLDFLIWLVPGAIIVGVAAGLYPAFYLSAIPPIAALTMLKKPKRSGFDLRQILVFLQFFVSISVVACTLIMSQQMLFVANKPLGYNNENKIVVELYGGDVIQNIPVIRNRLENLSSVNGVTETSFVPGQGLLINLMEIENNDGEYEKIGLFHMTVGPEFTELMDIQVVEGRDFSKEFGSDATSSVVVNETLVKTLGWDKPIGKRIKMFDATVVGVIQDFHVGSLHEPIPSLIVRPFPEIDFASLSISESKEMSRAIAISVSGDNLRQTIQDIEEIVSEFNPEHPFEFHFYDELTDQLYKQENNLMRLIGVFAIICIFISCLGLYGLSAFTTEQRTKEIGIRKVLGATTGQIIFMLVKAQMLLVVIAAGAASIASYMIMADWLQSFAYRTSINPLVFVVAVLVVATIAVLTVALQSARTANANPIKALRYE